VITIRLIQYWGYACEGSLINARSGLSCRHENTIFRRYNVGGNPGGGPSHPTKAAMRSGIQPALPRSAAIFPREYRFQPAIWFW
jgi:hypothetical protein